MENKNGNGLIVIGVIVVLVLIYLYLKKTGRITRQSTTLVDTGIGTPTAATGTPTGTPTSVSTGTGTGTGTPSAKQITLTKPVATYYQRYSKNAYWYDGPVAGVVFQAGKILTIVKEWQAYDGSGKYYETTETTTLNPAQNPEYNTHYLIKVGDI